VCRLPKIPNRIGRQVSVSYWQLRQLPDRTIGFAARCAEWLRLSEPIPPTLVFGNEAAPPLAVVAPHGRRSLSNGRNEFRARPERRSHSAQRRGRAAGVGERNFEVYRSAGLQPGTRVSAILRKPPMRVHVLGGIGTAAESQDLNLVESLRSPFQKP